MPRLPLLASRRWSHHTNFHRPWEDREETSQPHAAYHTHHDENKWLAGHLTENLRGPHAILWAVTSLFTYEETVAQRHEVICQSHISWLVLGWDSDPVCLAATPPSSLRGQSLCQPPWLPNCCASIRPGWTCLHQLNQKKVFHHAGHITSHGRRKQRKKTLLAVALLSSWLGQCTHS